MADTPIFTCVAFYLAGAFALLAWMAVLDHHTLREAFWLSILWPVTLVLIPFFLLLERLEPIDWHVEIMVLHRRPATSMFGFRRRDVGSGWAVRFLRLELQVWKDPLPA